MLTSSPFRRPSFTRRDALKTSLIALGSTILAHDAGAQAGPAPGAVAQPGIADARRARRSVTR